MEVSIDVRHAPKEIEDSSYHGFRVISPFVPFGISWIKTTSMPSE